MILSNSQLKNQIAKNTVDVFLLVVKMPCTLTSIFFRSIFYSGPLDEIRDDPCLCVREEGDPVSKALCAAVVKKLEASGTVSGMLETDISLAWLHRIRSSIRLSLRIR